MAEIFRIDEEFKNLIPPLTDEEFAQLEKNILRDGIREPLVIWNGTIIDGHNRYTIATTHNLPFNTLEMHFDNRADALQWIVMNQFGRRNISTFNRICLALKLKPVIAEKARARMTAGIAGDPTPNLAQGTTLDQIAKIAGVGKETVRKVEVILDKAPQEIIFALHAGNISIHAAYTSTKADSATAECIDRLKCAINKAKENTKGILHCLEMAKSILSPEEYQQWCIKIFNLTEDKIRSYCESILNLKTKTLSEYQQVEGK